MKYDWIIKISIHIIIREKQICFFLKVTRNCRWPETVEFTVYKFSEDDRIIIRNVFNFCKVNKVRGTSISLDQSSVRAAAMTGVSMTSLYKVVREHDIPPVTRTLPQSIQKLQLDSFDEGVIRRTLNSMSSIKRIHQSNQTFTKHWKTPSGTKDHVSQYGDCWRNLAFLSSV